MSVPKNFEIQLEKHHPDLMRYSVETRRVLNAYNAGGWDAVDKELSDIMDERWEAGKLAERTC